MEEEHNEREMMGSDPFLLPDFPAHHYSPSSSPYFFSHSLSSILLLPMFPFSQAAKMPLQSGEQTAAAVATLQQRVHDALAGLAAVCGREERERERERERESRERGLQEEFQILTH